MNFKDSLFQSWSDTNHEDVDNFLNKAFEVIEGDTQIHFQSSTKNRGWIATHLEVPFEELKWSKGPSDVPKGEYAILERESLKIAIHENREHAYLINSSEIKTKDLDKNLSRLFHLKPLKQINPKSHSWTLVAKSSNKNSNGKSTHTFNLSELNQHQQQALDIQQVLQQSSERIKSYTWKYVNYGDYLYDEHDRPPGMVDVFGLALEQGQINNTYQCGRGLKEIEKGLYQVKTPGFLIAENKILQIFSPVLVDNEETIGTFLIHEQMSQLIEKDFQHFIRDTGIKHGLIKEAYHAIIEKSKQLNYGLDTHIIAKYSEAIHGIDAKLEWRIPPLDHPGKVQEDGTIDFRENKKLFISKENECIAEKSKPIPGKDGSTILGNPISHRKPKDIRYTAGTDVELVEEEDKVLFIAKIKGVPKLNHNKVEVIAALVLPEGVNFNTGNISFDGNVYVQGSIQNGFSVSCTGNLIVYDSIENGAQVACKGHLTVGKGIIGNKTRIIAKNNIESRFIQEATVMGGQDLKVTDHLYHSKVRCEGKVIVDRCSKSNRGGSIIGGYVWGIKGVQAHYIGAPAETPTAIGVGIDEMRLKSAEQHQKTIDQLHQQVQYIMKQLNLSNIKKDSLDELALKCPKKLPLLNRLKEVILEYQSKVRLSDNLNKNSQAFREAWIKIENRIYPNVTMHHSLQQQVIKKVNFCKKWGLKDNLFTSL